MKVFIIGLDCAAPEILFSMPGLRNFRALMDRGCFGRLESVIPPITVPAWMCMSASQDPGSLGVYGFRNRTDYSYSGLGVVNSNSFHATTLWDVFGGAGLRSIVVGVPPSFPPRKLNGINVGCFLTPDTKNGQFTEPASVGGEILRLVGDYPVDVSGFRTGDKPWLRDQIYDMSRKHFDAIRYLMAAHEWDLFQFVEIGLDRIHHGFWKHHDPAHRQHDPNSDLKTVVTDYYQYLDDEIGQLLELLEDNTIVLVVSDHGAQRLDGGFCVNEWLCREGLLVLKERPAVPTPLRGSMVDWTKTKVWSEGGYYARVMFNVEGREPNGVIPENEYDSFFEEMKQRLFALKDDLGKPMRNLVFRPNEIYRKVNRVPPDMLVHFDALYWRSIGGVGYESLYRQENDTGPDDCNHAQFGSFILCGPGVPASGKMEGARLLDVAPTLLELANLKVPESMQGSSILRNSARL